MRTIRVTFLMPLLLVLAIGTVACGGNNGASPTAPSSAPAAAPSGGATISGTVVTGARTAALPMPAGLAAGSFASLSGTGRTTITVNGTSISVESNDDGSFVLQNVPEGDITLTITGAGFSAQVVVPGVATNAQIRVTIRVTGSTAELDDEEHVSDGKVEVEGRIVSVSGRTLVIGSRPTSVLVPEGTPIRHGSSTRAFSELVPGVRVHVKASRAGDVLTANEVKLQNDNRVGDDESDDDADDDDESDDDDDEFEMSGAVSGAISGQCPTISFSVAGTTVTTNASTKFDDVTCSTLKSGDTVKVEGTKQANGSVLAREVEKKGPSSDDARKGGRK
jgi:hypothetical protein